MLVVWLYQSRFVRVKIFVASATQHLISIATSILIDGYYKEE